MSGKIVQSDAINIYIGEHRDSFRKGELNSLAALVMSVSNWAWTVDGMEKALKLGQFQLATDWTVSVSDKLRVFLGTPDEVMAKLVALPRKKVSTLPTKVVTKMLALRFQRTWTQHQDYIAVVDANRNTHEAGSQLYKLKFPDFTSLEELNQFLFVNENVFTRNWRVQEMVRDLKKFLKDHSHLIEGDVVKDAWAMVQVREVMES